MRSDGPRRAPRFALATGVLFALAGCAHEMVENAARTVSEGQAANANDPQHQIVRVSAERAVAGTVDALNAPEQREKLRKLVAELVGEAVTTGIRAATVTQPSEALAGAVDNVAAPVADLMAEAARAAVEASLRGMIAELGQHGEGPLATTLANTGRTVSAAVVGSAMDELGHAFPGCKGPDALACVDRQIRQMSRAAGAGWTGGVKDAIGWAVLAMAALVGLAVGLLAHWLWSVRTHSRPLRTRTT